MSFPAGRPASIFAAMITIRECLAKLHAGEVCSLVVVSYDRRRDHKNGRRLRYDECALVWGDDKDQQPRSERALTELEKKAIGFDVPADRRNPNHQWHYTRNVRVYQQGNPTEMIVKIHPALIVEFNGETTCP